MENLNQHGIVVQTKVNFLADQSDEAANRFVFSYTITINNIGAHAAKLISRHWLITDSNNQVQEVRGLGVVGEQPLLKPKQSFEYTSGTVLATPVGVMRGSYEFESEDGSEFTADVPQFILSVPRVLH